MSRTALDRAERLFAAGRYADLISLLEPQVPIYRESQRFYYLLGSACLRKGDAGGASAYLKRAEQLDPRDRDTILALAALDLRRGESDRSVEAYLRILDDRPGDRLAKRALSVIRKEGSPERLAALIDSGRIARLYPGSGRAPPFVAPLCVALALGAALWLAAPLIREVARGVAREIAAAIARSRAPRPEIAALALSPEERESAVSTSGSFRYILTQDQALAAFEKAKAYFQEYRDNAAMVEINRLLGSNASPSIKEKARALSLFVGTPDFRTVRDAPDYGELSRDPQLYDGCAVAWKGMAANVASSGDSVEFDFLVGYEGKKRLEGVARSRARGISIPVDRPLEILARVAADGSAAVLDVVAVHELQAQR